MPVELGRSGRLTVSGPIATDTVWDAADITVVGDVTVEDGATLTIAAGATVAFDGFHQLRVEDGALQAVGTPAAPITFTSSEPEAWRPDLERTGAWNGLAFTNVPAACDSSRLRWCVLEYSKALPDGNWILPDQDHGGVLVDGIGGAVRMVGCGPLVVSHCILRNNLAERGGAIGLHHGARPLLVNNLIHDNHATLRASAIHIAYAEAVIVHSTFAGNEVTSYSQAVDTGCIDHVFARPWYLGNILWGNTSSYYWDLQIREPKAVNTQYCDIQEWEGGEGCLSVDPLLVDFVPTVGSPVIDAAADSPWRPDLDLSGADRWLDTAVDMGAFEVTNLTAVELPARHAVMTAWPNPFNPCTTIRFVTARPGPVSLEVVDPRGRRLATLFRGVTSAGTHELTWAPDGLPSGVYHLRLTTDDGSIGHGVVLLK